MARRPTFAERVAQTAALAPARARSKRVLSRAARAALAPADPTVALMAYSATMRTYAGRVEALMGRLVLSRLPVLGSGDPLDRAAIEGGLLEMEGALDQLAERSRRSAAAAAKRAGSHARREAQRILGMSIPAEDPKAALVAHDFAARGVERMRRVGRAQVAQARKALANYQEGSSLKAELERSLWVSRVRGQLVARDLVFGLQTRMLREYSQAVGGSRFVWHTRHDEFVRPGHQVLDGKEFDWSAPPNTGGGEGNNLPGEAPNCRCAAVPVQP